MVIEHNLKTLGRDILLFLVAAGLLLWFQKELVSAGYMSGDNAKDTFIWAVIIAVAVVAVFSAVFVIQALFIVPFQMWDEAGGASPSLATSVPEDTEGVPAIKRTAYTSKDIERLLEALQEAHEFINDKPVPIEQELHRLREQWYTQIVEIGPKDYIAKVNAIIQRINDFKSEMDEFIFKRHAYYKDPIQVALNLDGYPERINWGLVQFTKHVDGLPDEPEIRTVRILDEQFGKYLDTNWVGWRQWIIDANKRIEKITDNLRKEGITGYEEK